MGRDIFVPVLVLLLLLFSPEVDNKPNAEQAGAAGGAAAEPSTSQPQRTEETSEKTPDQPDESKVCRDNFSSAEPEVTQS